MRKATKKIVSASLVAVLALSLVACGGSKDPVETTKAPEATTAAGETTTVAEVEVVKPSTINVMMDGTVLTEANGRDAFEEQLEEALGGDIDIVFNQPEHSGYYDVVGTTFAGGDWPDVILLGAAYYSTYASAGALWDMTEAWESSDLKASGRVINEAIIDGLYIDGSLYGFAPTRGNGCITYMKQSWLDAVGLDAPTNYDEYYEVIKAFTEGDPDQNGVDGDTYGVTAAGLVGGEAPYVNYLPEFYQDAYPDFYQNENGEWVDGFSEDAMKGALTRLQDAYSAGYLDKETITNGTSDCRNKFYDDKVGVFTYWAGVWQSNLTDNLIANGYDGDLVAVAPIAEVGNYVERQAPVWAITTQAENPEGIFKYFIETMLDGDRVQTLWTYGAEDTHWTTANGEFEMLPSPEKPDTMMKKNHIDSMLSIATFTNGDPGANTQVDIAAESGAKFNEWAVMAPVIVNNDTTSSYAADLWDIKNKVITDVVTAGVSVDEGMAYYVEQSASMVAEILESFK